MRFTFYEYQNTSSTMKKSLNAILSFLFVSTGVSAKTIDAEEKGTWTETWRRCIAEETQDFLMNFISVDSSGLVKSKPFKNYSPTGADYVGELYVVDFKNEKDQEIRVWVNATIENTQFFHPFRAQTENAMSCYIDTRRYNDIVVIKIVEKTNESNVFYEKKGTLGKRPFWATDLSFFPKN